MSRLINAIPQKQNSFEQLDLLAAQRTLYIKIKNFFYLQIIVTVILPIVISLFLISSNQIKSMGIITGMTLTLIDYMFIDNRQKDLREKAAKEQELFDCQLLGIKWNRLKIGTPPSYEEIKKASDRIKRNNDEYNKLKNWYPPIVGEVPLTFGKLICQRTNCYFDLELRRPFRILLVLSLILLISGPLVLGVIKNMSLEDFLLAIFAPLFPLILWFSREYSKQTEAIKSVEDIKTKIENIWDEIMIIGKKNPDFDQKVRVIQDQIYDYRREAPLIPDQFYRLFQNKTTQQLDYGAQKLVKQVKKRTSK